MRFLELIYNKKTYNQEREIIKILSDNGFYWLIDSEIENSKIEIKKNTIIWNDGIFISGDWNYGIFKNGEFYGTWEGGIFENGNFQGKWIDGINLTKFLS